MAEKMAAGRTRRPPAKKMYPAANGSRNQPSYLVSVPAMAASPAPAAAHSDFVSLNSTVKYSIASKAPKNTTSVIGVDCRYSKLGLSANTVTATVAATAP